MLFGFLVFNVLGAISDTYLAPALETVSKKLKLSETISGITLLAFAASAPDVVTGLVAGGKEEGGSRIVVGGLFGACLFTVTVVLAGCVKGAGEVHADKKALARDIGFLLIAVLYFLVLTLFEEITPLMGCGFFVIYVIFFVYVILTEKRKREKGQGQSQGQNQSQSQANKEHSIATIEMKDPTIVVDEEKERTMSGVFPILEKNLRKIKTHNEILSNDDSDEEREMGVSHLNIDFRKGWRRMDSEIPKLHKRKSSKMPAAEKPKIKRTLKRAMTDNVTHLLKKSHESESDSSGDEEEHEEVGFFHKIVKMVSIPILFIGDLTMPPVETERWNNWMTAMTAILGPLFLIWQLGFIEEMESRWWNWVIFGMISASLAVVIFFKGKAKNLADHYQGLFSSITLVISVFWLNMVSTLVVDFLMFVQKVTGLSLYFLSITILAWGNSLEDYFVNYAIAKNGRGKTALGGVYGSQIFAIMIGFGGGLVRLALKENVKLGLYNFTGEGARENIMTLVLLGATILALVLTLVVAGFAKWVIGKKVVVFVLVFYVMFTVGITVISFA